MSLILEALRKSEAERQRGRAPGLFVEQTTAGSRARSGTPAWAWAVGGVLVAMLAVFAWREWSRPLPAEPAAGLETSPAPGTVAPRETPPIAQAPALAQAPPEVAPPPLPAPAPAATPPAVETSPAPPARAPTAQAANEPAAAPPPATVAPATTGLPAADPAQALAPEPALPTVSSLAASERAQLPPLKLSMHVYAEQPAQRFVILDGQRLGEGASPAAGLVVDQIRRDGLVLSVNGQRLLLPRP